MKKTISILVLMIYLLVALDIPTAFAYSEGTSLLAIETLSTEKDNKLIQFNPYITELGSIGIHLKVIKDDILNRGDISLTVVSPDDVIPLYEGKVPLENFDFAITNIEKNKDYDIVLIQEVEKYEYIYHGVFCVEDINGILQCKSTLVEEVQTKIEVLEEQIATFSLLQGSDTDSDQIVRPIDGKQLPFDSKAIQTTRQVRWEVENNNTRLAANRIYDDDTLYGTISSTSDVDWYVVSFNEYGQANFWLGDIPEGWNFYLQLYDDGGNLLRTSATTARQQQIYGYQITPFKNYYLRVYPDYRSFSTYYYRLRAKIYPTPTPTFSHNYVGGFSNIKYYLYNDKYSKDINDALYDWQSPPSSVGTNIISPIKKTNSINEARIAFNHTDFNKAFLGLTTFYSQQSNFLNKTGGVEGNESNWSYSLVTLSPADLAETTVTVRSVVSHELGHVWGLQHNSSNPHSIMCTKEQGRRIDVVHPSKTDMDAFNRKYG